MRSCKSVCCCESYKRKKDREREKERENRDNDGETRKEREWSVPLFSLLGVGFCGSLFLFSSQAQHVAKCSMRWTDPYLR